MRSLLFFLCCLFSIDGVVSGVDLETRSLNVTLQPKDGVQLMLGQSAVINISTQINEPQYYNDSFVISLLIRDRPVASFNGSANVSFVLDPAEWLFISKSRYEYSISVQMNGNRVGITSLSVSIALLRSSGQIWTNEAAEYAVRVAKTPSTLNRGLRLGTVGAMSLNFMTFGCMLRYGDLKKYLKQPLGIFTGFILQYALMPVITYLMGLAGGLKTHFAFALFAVGCAPGGGPSNLITVILRGDLQMSIIMTFISTVAALGMIPLWMFTLGRVILKTGYPASEIQMPWAILVIAVLWFSVPTAVGMVIGRCWPRVAKVIVMVVRPVAFLFLIVQVAVFIYFNYPVLYFADTWQLFAVTAATPYIAYVLSFVLAVLVFRRTLADALTIMVETGIQNITFAFFLIVATLPQPDGDIASVVPLLVIFFTYGPIFFVVFPVAGIVNRMKDKRKAQGYTLSGVGDKVTVDGKVNGRSSVTSETQLMTAESDGNSTVSLESVNVTHGRCLFYDYISPENESEKSKETTTEQRRL